MSRPYFHCFVVLILAFPVQAQTVDYLHDVKPLLEHKCYACHGALKQQSGLRVDTAASLKRGGDSGEELVVAGQPDDSLLIGVVTGEAGFRMPPANEGSPLSESEIATLRQWIQAGASSPADEAQQADPRTWWSYRAIARPTPPEVEQAAWCRNPIDQFIAASRESHGLQSAPEASKASWLRRVYIDLIGLPPTRDELHEFLADNSVLAYESVVDELLARPQYGERWGRHWMDIWRYSDWYGSRGINEIRYSQRHIWRWRDWIIGALNDDQGYDQMIREMLAADEIAGGDPNVLPATGYLARSWYKFDRDVWLFETVERTGEAFLGLTLRCCRCHDHKFDPITQEEYFRFRAFFEPHDVRTDPISALTGTQKDATLGQVLDNGIALVYDKQPDAKTYRFERGDNRYPDESKPLDPGVPAALGGNAIVVHPIELPPAAWYPMLRDGVRQTLITKAELDIAAANQKLAGMQAALTLAKNALATALETPPDVKTQVEPFLHDTFASANAEMWNSVDGTWVYEDGKLIEKVSLVESIETLKQRVVDAERNVRLSSLELDATQAELRSVRARLEAEMAAQYAQKSEQIHSLATQAFLAERRAEIAETQIDIYKLSQHQTSDAELKQLAEAEVKLAAAQTALDNPAESYGPLGDQYPKQSTGRRTALANWIASPSNPRTARVAANHLWSRHFGRPLVDSTENFGLNGRTPTHPELLDWLASELMANDWRMKPLHRQIVLSSTYRLSSQTSSNSPEQIQDPENKFWWRSNSRRMEAEVVRDSVVYLAGQLDMKLGGPEITESEGEKVLRRSVYFRNTPNEKMDLLETFDVADPNACYRRKESVVPHQSLALMNSGLTLDHARTIAGQIEGTDVDFVQKAFEVILARAPTEREAALSKRFLIEHAELVATSSETFPAGGTAKRAAALEASTRARENLVHVLFLHNDFVTIR